MRADELFALPESLQVFAKYFLPEMEPWAWLTQVKVALAELDFASLPQRSDIPAGLAIEGEKVFIDPTAKLPPYGSIKGPVWIGPECELRPGVYIRGNVICGKGCVLGNSSEFKNALLLDGVQAPHFNYVGDSVLGNKAHLGAGVILANLRLDQGNVPVQTPHGRCNSGLRKLGGIFGDEAEAGCNTVINPGTILGKRAIVMPGNPFGGLLEANRIAMTEQSIRRIRRPKGKR